MSSVQCGLRATGFTAKNCDQRNYCVLALKFKLAVTQTQSLIIYSKAEKKRTWNTYTYSCYKGQCAGDAVAADAVGCAYKQACHSEAVEHADPLG